MIDRVWRANNSGDSQSRSSLNILPVGKAVFDMELRHEMVAFESAFMGLSAFSI